MKCYLYFITDGNFTKIGISNDPVYRLNTLQTGNQNKLDLLFVVKSTRTQCEEMEKELHQHSRKSRVRGEWFNINTLDIFNLVRHIQENYTNQEIIFNFNISCNKEEKKKAVMVLKMPSCSVRNDKIKIDDEKRRKKNEERERKRKELGSHQRELKKKLNINTREVI